MNELLNRTSSITVHESIKAYLEVKTYIKSFFFVFNLAFLLVVIKIGLENLYEETKKQTKSNSLKESTDSSYESNMVYSLIIFCREQINYYKKSELKSYFRQLDVPSIVINVLYAKLMKDVKTLCENHLEELYDVI